MVRAAQMLQTFARRYAKDARSKIQARSIVSNSLVQLRCLRTLLIVSALSYRMQRTSEPGCIAVVDTGT